MRRSQDTEHADVLIIGGGPSGLAAGARLKRLGVRDVVLIERQPELGGIPRQCEHPGFGLRHLKRPFTGPGYARMLVRRAQESGVRCLTATSVVGLDAVGKSVQCVSAQGHQKFAAGAILIATGCRETTRSALLIPGFRGPGIITTGQVQQMWRDLHRLPGRRVVILGSEDVGLSAVHLLGDAGARVAAVVEQRSHLVGHRLFALASLVTHGVRLHTGHTVKRILGRRRVEAVEIGPVDATGTSGPGRIIACDTLVVSGRFVPENELCRSGGVPVDDRTQGPAVDQCLQTDVPGVYAAGNVLRGVETADVAAMEGEWVADCIHQYLRAPSTNARGTVKLRPGAHVRWVMPQMLSTGHPDAPAFLATLRVEERLKGGRIKCGDDGRVWQSRRFRRMLPERRFRINPRAWMMDGAVDEVSISIQPDGD